MKKLLFLLVVLALAGGGVYYYYNYGKPKEKPTVQMVAVSKGSIVEVVQSTGTLEALRTVQVGSQVSGTVSDLFGVDFNSIVKKGQKIAQLDDSLLQVQVKIQEANIDRQLGDIENQKVQLADSVRNLGRQKELAAKGLSKQQDLEQADLTVKSREASIASAEKQVISARAQLDQAKLNVQYTTIYAPIDGVIVDRRVDIGQTVQASMTTPQFFTIATDLTKLKLTAGVDEAEIGKVQAGMEVLFTVDSYQGQTFVGTVNAVRLNATTQNNVVTYPVWIDVPNNDLKLRPSMTANIRVVIRKVDDTLRIPNGAFRFKPNNEIYLALGLTPPTAGRGTRLADAGAGGPGGGRADQGGDPNSSAPPNSGAPTTPGQAPGSNGQGVAQAGGRGQGGQPGQPGGRGGQGGQGGGQNAQNAQNGQGGQNRGNRTPGSGFGAASGLTDEQRAAAMQAFMQGGGANRNGGRGGGAGGRGGRNNQNGGRGGFNGRASGTPANATGNTTPMTERNADKIDELFEPIPMVPNRQTVWTWDEAKKELKSTQVMLGVSDGQFSQLISGDVTLGQQLVTGVILPVVKAAPGGVNPLFGGQGGRNPGGMMPGGNPGGGGGNPGGGGRGGGGGGGGGGGRGGGN
jgi:HlyD family secretion protein